MNEAPAGKPLFTGRDWDFGTIRSLHDEIEAIAFTGSRCVWITQTSGTASSHHWNMPMLPGFLSNQRLSGVWAPISFMRSSSRRKLGFSSCVVHHAS